MQQFLWKETYFLQIQVEPVYLLVIFQKYTRIRKKQCMKVENTSFLDEFILEACKKTVPSSALLNFAAAY